MMLWQILLAIYLVGVALIALLTNVLAGNEPTAHGQGILFSIGCSTAILWPVAIPVWILFAIVGGLQMLWARIRGKEL